MKTFQQILTEALDSDEHIHDKIQKHLAAGGKVRVVTHYKATEYSPKHASMFKKPKDPQREGGVYVQHGKRWDYTFPEYVHFSRLVGEGLNMLKTNNVNTGKITQTGPDLDPAEIAGDDIIAHSEFCSGDIKSPELPYPTLQNATGKPGDEHLIRTPNLLGDTDL